MNALLMSLLGRVKQFYDDSATHFAATGTSVHGLGDMSLQDNATVDIDGGAVDGAVIGATTPAAGGFTRVREKRTDHGAGTSFPLDWSAAAAFRIAPNAAYAVTHTNKPANHIYQGIIVEVVNGGLYTPTWTGVTWITAAPTLKTSGSDWLLFFCVDGSTVLGSKLA